MQAFSLAQTLQRMLPLAIIWFDFDFKFFFFLNRFSTVFTGMAQSFSVTKLKELSSYTFRISARNDAGDGSFSEPKTFYTKAQPPQVVKGKKSFILTAVILALSLYSF